MSVEIDFEKRRRINYLVNLKGKSYSKIGKDILNMYDYNPVPLDPSVQINNGLNNGIECGVDDIMLIKEIPTDDSLNLKQVNPNNKDLISVDYRSNNFRTYTIENDNYIFVKVMELSFKHYGKDTLWKEHDKGKDIRIKGILSHENPDYLFFIRHTFNEARGNLPNDSLINAYLLPVEPLKEQVIHNLNQINIAHNKQPLDFNKHSVDLISDIYQTWKLYRKDKGNYEFELIRIRDSNQPDLMMKIRKDYLFNYIKFDAKGEIME
jgi:hypothetical protein